MYWAYDFRVYRAVNDDEAVSDDEVGRPGEMQSLQTIIYSISLCALLLFCIVNVGVKSLHN